MDSMSISEFKATCLAVLERVRVTGIPLLISRHGEPVAEIGPPRPPATASRQFLGRLRGTAQIVGNITDLVVSAQEFEQGTLHEADASKP